MKKYVLIPAGGIGSRMGAAIPKQFLTIAGKPIIAYTIEQFIKAVPDISVVVVLPGDYFSDWEKIKEKYFPETTIYVTRGGIERFDSVKNGLKLLTGKGLVAIHDAVRPFAGTQLILDCFSSAEKYGSGVAAVTPKDSVFKAGKKVKSKDRKEYRLAQTPQTFSIKEIKKAYTQKYKSSFTDDASVWEANGNDIRLVKGDYSNIKITTKEDLLLAEMLLKKQ